MPQWEYCELEAYGGGAFGRFNAKLIFYKPDGKHIENKTLENGIALARLGANGWELVSVIHRESVILRTELISYFFRRPLPDPVS